MKAARFHEYGDADVLHYEDVDMPRTGPDEVRVKVAASAFNPLDAGLRGGWVRDAFPLRLPHTPGYDVAGTVDEVGDAVTSLQVGDRVVGFLPMIDDGSAAQYVVAPAAVFTDAPSRIPLSDAAALPSVGVTAWQALFEAGRLQAGQRVLINGAGGSVGRVAVQLASHAGARVVATSTPSSAERLRAAGAAEVLDHSDAVDDFGAPVDVLLNLGPVTPEALARLVGHVRSGGVVVNTVPSVQTPGDPARDVEGVGFFVRNDAATLAHLVALVDQGALEVDVAERVALSELPAVHARADAGELRGKVLVLPPAE